MNPLTKSWESFRNRDRLVMMKVYVSEIRLSRAYDKNFANNAMEEEGWMWGLRRN